ncbi:hypothetical protein GGX14DRAFT_398871 [Mycena pura]|uniref:Uncharacterized protein n=1 Tax=Mycena pura TaxID=153505 RepID=A0AAD6V5R2_9AGAR|nr:hypothetical protein GGX14DRAFT_398871 [Mycena pura]
MSLYSKCDNCHASTTDADGTYSQAVIPQHGTESKQRGQHLEQEDGVVQHDEARERLADEVQEDEGGEGHDEDVPEEHEEERVVPADVGARGGLGAAAARRTFGRLRARRRGRGRSGPAIRGGGIRARGLRGCGQKRKRRARDRRDVPRGIGPGGQAGQTMVSQDAVDVVGGDCAQLRRALEGGGEDAVGWLGGLGGAGRGSAGAGAGARAAVPLRGRWGRWGWWQRGAGYGFETEGREGRGRALNCGPYSRGGERRAGGLEDGGGGGFWPRDFQAAVPGATGSRERSEQKTIVMQPILPSELDSAHKGTIVGVIAQRALFSRHTIRPCSYESAIIFCSRISVVASTIPISESIGFRWWGALGLKRDMRMRTGGSRLLNEATRYGAEKPEVPMATRTPVRLGLIRAGQRRARLVAIAKKACSNFWTALDLPTVRISVRLRPRDTRSRPVWTLPDPSNGWVPQKASSRSGLSNRDGESGVMIRVADIDGALNDRKNRHICKLSLSVCTSCPSQLLPGSGDDASPVKSMADIHAEGS